MEVMQDRRLKFDDNRGIGQGIQDNQPVLNIFRLLLENIEPCTKADSKQTNGFLTSQAHVELQSLLYPMEKLIWHANEWTGVQADFGANRDPLDADIQVAVLRDLPHVKRIELKSRSDKQRKGSSLGLVVHRTNVLKCKSDANLSGVVSFWKQIKCIFKYYFFILFHRLIFTVCWALRLVNPFTLPYSQCSKEVQQLTVIKSMFVQWT